MPTVGTQGKGPGVAHPKLLFMGSPWPACFLRLPLAPQEVLVT